MTATDNSRADVLTERVRWTHPITRDSIATLIAQHQRDGKKQLDAGLDASGSYLIQVAESLQWCLDQLAASPVERHEAAPAGHRTALTAEDVERQYRDGVHIGSGLPRATCPCGFCMKHRHGFNRGDEAIRPEPRTEGEAVYRFGNDGVCRVQAAALEGTGNGADNEYQVSIDVRDLFAYLRAAWREGQHYDREDTPDQADSWSAASDYANKTIDRWTSMRPIISLAPRTEVAGAVPHNILVSLECAALWLENGCEAEMAATEIRMSIEKLRALQPPSADAAASRNRHEDNDE